MDMTVAGVLEAAARRLEAGGWGQGFDSERAFPCVGDAIIMETGGRSWSGRSAFRALALHIRPDTVADSAGFNYCAVVWRWNDHTGRTKEEVLAALRACALIERARDAAPTASVSQQEITA